jgi:cellulose synthase/poly-beta-1,6-N-acetylglucosamine synthase-like glycosyltransferase
MELLFVPVAVLYFAVVGALFIYGINFFYLAALSRLTTPSPVAPPLTAWPRVTIQLPIFNELYVAERLIDAAASLDYPRDLLDIQVLDDSTDETVGLARARVADWRARGVNITHFHRLHRVGFKAGALAHGLTHALGEYLAVFDADFVPPPDFLRRVLPHFHDAQVAFVQARWQHINHGHSLLTRLEGLALDAHFIIEQFVRFQHGYWFNFNGTAGVWRRAALEDAGGWQADTLTEDLDLSYRAFLRGWRAVYLRDLEVPGELPVSFNAYRRQQHRWARGSFECAVKLLPPIWRGPGSVARKMQATLHLTSYGIHLLLFVMSLLFPVVLAFSVRYPGVLSLSGLAVIFNITLFAPSVFFAAAQWQTLGRGWWRLLPLILLFNLFGTGMILNTTRAAWHVVRHQPGVFERTPKFGLLRAPGEWLGHRYQIRFDVIVLYELALALFNLASVLFAIQTRNWTIAFYAALFCVSLLFTASLSLAQTLAGLRVPHPRPLS